MADKPRRIPASELSAYERWELPTLGGGDSGQRAVPGAGKVKPLTADDLEKIRKDAYDDGFREGRQAGIEAGKKEGIEQGKKTGYQQGLEKGREDGAQQIQQSVAQLTQMVKALADPLADQQHHVEQAMLNVALAISRSVIHRELHLDTDVIRSVLLEVMALLPKNASGIRVEVSPADYEYAQDAMMAVNSEAELVSSPTIHPGGCMVVTSTQQLDYTVEKRFQKVVHQMLVQANASSASQVPLESPDTFEELSEYPAALMDEASSESSAEHSEPVRGLEATDTDPHSPGQTGGEPEPENPIDPETGEDPDV